MQSLIWPITSVLSIGMLLLATACDESNNESAYVNVDATTAQTPVMFVGDEVVGSIGLEDASIICEDGTAQLRLTPREPLPPDAQLNIQTLRESATTSTDTQEFSPVGEAIRLALKAGSETKIAVTISEVDGLEEADIVGVYFTAVGPDGVNLQSQTESLAASDFRC